MFDDENEFNEEEFWDEEPPLNDIITEITEGVLNDVTSLGQMALNDIEKTFKDHCAKRKREYEADKTVANYNRLEVSEKVYFDYKTAMQIYFSKLLEYLDGYRTGCREASNFAGAFKFGDQNDEPQPPLNQEVADQISKAKFTKENINQSINDLLEGL